MQHGYRQRGDRHAGQHQHIHNFVATGSVGWESKGFETPAVTECHDLVLPPVQLENTTSEQIAAALMLSLERWLLNGVGFETWMNTMSRKCDRISLCVVADSAASNMKLTWRLLSYFQALGARAGMAATGHFAQCILHQLARILVTALERYRVSPAMYSITRLNQNTATRSKTWEALKGLLAERFVYTCGPVPPDTRRASPEFRRNLKKLLIGYWDFEEPSTTKQALVTQLFDFFNGDIADEKRWCHFCKPGCCKNKQEAMNKVGGPGHVFLLGRIVSRLWRIRRSGRYSQLSYGR